MNKLFSYTGGILILLFLTQKNIAQPPAPYGVVPKPHQLKMIEMERHVLMHFTPTTFQNKEWGFGDADPKIFNPIKFDAKQIVAAIKAGGFGGLTVVAKHHDGFCLWPTKSTEYNISKTPFRAGKGDLVKEMQAALNSAGLQMGVYCSPWDRNSAFYADKKYVTDVFYKQLEELYTSYGNLYTVFFDGANGGDGYYGGSNEKRKIEASTYYDYQHIYTNIARKHQPQANIFSDIGPDLRWVGNESGAANETCWATFTPMAKEEGKAASPGLLDESNLGTGTRNGKQWTVAECDVPMRKGWFYHKDEEATVKTPEELLNIYYSSVGRGATLNLGISPNTDGLLSDGDVKKLADFGKLVNTIFKTNLAKSATVKASNIRANSKAFSPKFLLDNDRYSYWATADEVTTPDVVFEFKAPVKFNVIRLRENVKLGQRIEEVAIDAWSNNEWREIAKATGIGYSRLIRLSSFITAKKVRLRVVKSPVCVALSDFGLFAEPEHIAAGRHLVQE